MVNGISEANLGQPNYELALEQHNNYIKALKSCGLEVIILEAEEEFPDSVFVEDTALCTPKCAIITNPGANSRKGETRSIESALKKHYSVIEHIEEPGSIDAGDIMMVGKHFYIGLSDRTNTIGAKQMITTLEKHGMTGSTVDLATVLHLKTGISYLENNNLLVSGEFINKKEFENFNKVEITAIESYAANSLWINSKVLIPLGFPDTLGIISNLGYECIVLDMSEFRKLDGGLSCLSLRF